MAIRRLDPAARFRLVSQMDPAVDRTDETEAAARYAAYLESLDPGALKFKDGETPTFFTVRPMTNIELATFNSKYLKTDPEQKRSRYENQSQMFFEMFDLCCEGMQDGNDPMTKVTSNEVSYAVANEIGSIISLIATLGKHLKKA